MLKNVSCEYDRWMVETQLCKLRDIKTRSLGELVLCSICIVPERDQKKKSVTAGLHDDPDRLVVVKKRGCDWGACGGPWRRETGLSKQGCDWGACGRPRRDETSPPRLALRDGRGEGDPHAGTCPRDSGLSLGASLATRRGLAAEK